MVLHKDGITIPSLKLAIFILTTWHLHMWYLLCALISHEVHILPHWRPRFQLLLFCHIRDTSNGQKFVIEAVVCFLIY
jgi:hypothetical protein